MLHPKIKPIDAFFLILVFFLFLISGYFLTDIEIETLIFVDFCFIFIIFVVIEVYRRLMNLLKQVEDKESTNIYDSISGEIFINNLGFNIPPIFNKWSIDGDLAKIIIEEIIKRENPKVLEFGSGSSTMIISKILNILEKGKLYSIEHDEKYFNNTKKLIELNKLSGVNDLILVPLEKIDINGKEWLWYKTDFLEKIRDKIDILLIDGPPGYIQRMSRFPALPVIINRLNDHAVIFLDDGNREDEKKIIKEWRLLYPHLTYEYVNTLKGAWKIYYERKSQ